jgi:hypothetical protein
MYIFFHLNKIKMWSYQTGQILIIVLCALIVIGFALWLFSSSNSKYLKNKKNVRFNTSGTEEDNEDDDEE